MREWTARVLWALAIGFLLTAGLATAAYLSHSVGAEGIARVLFWQNTLLQNLVPMYNMGTPERPFYEGTVLNYLAFIASFPLGFIVYSVVAYIGLSKRANNEQSGRVVTK